MHTYIKSRKMRWREQRWFTEDRFSWRTFAAALDSTGSKEKKAGR